MHYVNRLYKWKGHVLVEQKVRRDSSTHAGAIHNKQDSSLPKHSG